MPTLTRAPNGDHFARKGIPADIREAYAAAYGVRREALFRQPAGTPDPQVKKAFAEWLAEVEGRIAALRAAARGQPVSMTTREVHALAERWYLWFIARHENDPGSVELWESLSEQMQDVWESGFDGMGDPEEWDEETVTPAHRRRIRAKLTELSQLPSFLAAEGLNLSQDTTNAMLDGPLGVEFGVALKRLMRLASGDFGPDARTISQVPTPAARASTNPTGLTACEAFRAWVTATAPRPSTVNRWRAMFLDLDIRFHSKDVAHYTGDDARKWRDALLEEGKSRVVVRDVWLTAARAVFNWLREEKRLIPANPFLEARLKKGKATRTREPFFSSEEIKIILTAALAPSSPRINSYLRDAYRWVPWLCAYTGARSGEITQLRAEDVRKDADTGAWVMDIKPEAGTVKGQVARTVPLHEHLIAQGFVEFAAARKGPLFYDPSRHEESDDPTNPVRPPYVLVRQKLAAWVRRAGVTDKGISPNHGWRHTFKRRAAKKPAEIEERLRDAICGHSDGRAKAVYETPTVDELVDAIAKFPRYEIETP
jgi:integrase